MEIVPFQPAFLPQASALFAQNFQRLRKAVPVLPDAVEGPWPAAEKLAWLFGFCPGIAALEDGKLIGYMGWFTVERFRGSARKGAYCPEWGHAALEGRKSEVYRAMYRAASAQWAAAGCQVHALTLLAHDPDAERTWFWNGFGLTVVDAIRPMVPLGVSLAGDLCIRKATQEDAGVLSQLDAEHCQHYSHPPVLMPLPTNESPAEFAAFLAHPKNRIWLALDGETPVGFMRFTGGNFDAVEIINADTTVMINAAYVRPAYRGRRAAVLMLESAIREYAALGIERLAVNFESFNPEAALFWMRYFEPICLSVLRVPEA